MKKIVASILLMLIVLTIVLSFTTIHKQNHSGEYSSIFTITKQDEKWIIENFSQYETVEELIVGINDYICHNFTYKTKLYIQHFDFAETISSKSGLCYDFASLQKVILLTVANHKDWKNIKVHLTEVRISLFSGHAYNFICVGDKKYYSDPTNDLWLYQRNQEPEYYTDIGNLTFEEYVATFNEKIMNIH